MSTPSSPPSTYFNGCDESGTARSWSEYALTGINRPANAKPFGMWACDTCLCPCSRMFYNYIHLFLSDVNPDWKDPTTDFSKVNRILDHIGTALNSFCDHEYDDIIPLWTPDPSVVPSWGADGQMLVDHIKDLKIPSLKNRPSLLLHKLGNLSDTSKVNGIFISDADPNKAL